MMKMYMMLKIAMIDAQEHQKMYMMLTMRCSR